MPDLHAQLEADLAGRYTLVRQLGRGGMATVFLATDVKHDRSVALKVLDQHLAESLGPERFQREIRLAARLQHPHVLTVFDSGEAAGHLWFTMPYVEGESLRDRLEREGQLPLADALRIARQAASALHYAHEQGVVHRDVKPENLLLTGGGDVLVADFGIARPIEQANERLTQTGFGVGTPAYMSPEQATAEPDVDARTDVYSLGAVLFEMLAGEPPYRAPTAAAIMARQLSGPVPSVRLARAEVLPAVDAVVQRALATERDERFASAEEMSGALEHAAGGAMPAPGHVARPELRGDRSTRVRLLVGVGVVLAAALGAVWFATRRAPAAPATTMRVAVLPFAVHGGKGHEYLSQGLVDLLSRNLEGVAELQTVDGATVLSAARAEKIDAPDVAQGRALARRVGAGTFVLGSVSGAGGQLRIDATLYDAAPEQPVPLARETVTGDTAQLLALVDRLAGALAVSRERGPGGRLAQTAAATTQSLPALKSYLSAEQALRRSAYDSAIAGYERAVQADSTFALAFYRLAVAGAWSQRWRIVRPNATRATQLASRLGARDQQLLGAFAALVAGRPDDAERAYRDVLQEYPDDLEARWQLATLLVSYNPLRGRDAADAWPLLESVRQLDPAFLCTVCTMRGLAMHQGDTARALALMARRPLRYGDSVQFAVAREDAATLARLRATAESPARNVEAVATAAWLVGQWIQRPDAAEPFARAAAMRSDRSIRSINTLSKNQLAQGRWEAADSALTIPVAGGAPGFTQIARGLTAMLPFLAVPRAPLETLRAQLAAWQPAPLPHAVPSARTPPIGLAILALTRQYVLALLDSRLGDAAGALRGATVIEQTADSVPELAAVARALAGTVRADVALVARRPADALKALEAARGMVPLEMIDGYPHTEDYARFLRGEALVALGRDDEALRWFEHGFDQTSAELIFRAPILLRLGDIYARKGEREKAIDAYGRFVRMWARCDAPLRPTVDEARRRMARLTSGAR